MNYDFDFDHRTRLLKVSFSGDVDAPSLIAATQKLRQLIPDLDPAMSLTDFSAVTSLEILAGTVNSLAELRPVFAAQVPQVIVAPASYLFGLARMFQTVGAERRPNLHVVRTLAEAHQWLGLTEAPQFERLKVA